MKITADDFNAMIEQFPDIRSSLQQSAHERIHENELRYKRVTTVPVDKFLEQGLMEAQSLLVLDLAEVHALRPVREGLRRFARWCYAADSRWSEVRKLPGGHFMPAMPRSALHGGLSGGVDSPSQLARSDHRGLVHRLRIVCVKLSIRKHQYSSVRSAPRESGIRPG